MLMTFPFLRVTGPFSMPTCHASFLLALPPLYGICAAVSLSPRIRRTIPRVTPMPASSPIRGCGAGGRGKAG
jgi:hypothetical protein